MAGGMEITRDRGFDWPARKPAGSELRVRLTSAVSVSRSSVVRFCVTIYCSEARTLARNPQSIRRVSMVEALSFSHSS